MYNIMKEKQEIRSRITNTKKKNYVKASEKSIMKENKRNAKKV